MCFTMIDMFYSKNFIWAKLSTSETFWDIKISFPIYFVHFLLGQVKVQIKLGPKKYKKIL